MIRGWNNNETAIHFTPFISLSIAMFLDHLWFVGKVLLISFLLTLGIKYIAPLLPIPVNALSALIAVLGVPGIMALVLGLDRVD